MKALAGHIGKLVILCLLVAGGSLLLWTYEKKWSEEAKRQQVIRELQEKNKALQDFVTRLTTHRRMAEMFVVDQIAKGDQVESTTLLFLEYGPEGTEKLPPKFFTIAGNEPHIDSMLIQFDYGFIENSDALRGKNIALFHRLYGDRQAPIEGYRIDEPGRAPEVYQTAQSPAAHEFEQELWQNFWRLVDDPKYRAEKGVRVAEGVGNWTKVKPDQVYTITIGTAGGISIHSNPMDAVWKEYRSALNKVR
jgi:hypothetical protein